MGHAGTLDPLASGVLPVAFGEATKTVPIVQDGAKAYDFASAGARRPTTDDAEGAIVAPSDRRPAPSEIEAALPGFVGLVQQDPPTFSAIRIAGARAYDLARGGERFEIAARPIQRLSTAVVSAEVHAAVLEAECGKGTYIRAIARDLGRALGCYGHVVVLRRTRVGPFVADSAVPLDRLPDDAELMACALSPLQAGLAELPSLPVDRNGAARLRRGQKLLVRDAARGGGTRLGRVFWRSRLRSARSRTATSSRRACSTEKGR